MERPTTKHSRGDSKPPTQSNRAILTKHRGSVIRVLLLPASEGTNLRHLCHRCGSWPSYQFGPSLPCCHYRQKSHSAQLDCPESPFRPGDNHLHFRLLHLSPGDHPALGTTTRTSASSIFRPGTIPPWGQPPAPPPPPSFARELPLGTTTSGDSHLWALPSLTKTPNPEHQIRGQPPASRSELPLLDDFCVFCVFCGKTNQSPPNAPVRGTTT